MYLCLNFGEHMIEFYIYILVTPSKIKNLKLSDNRLEVWPRNRETSLFQILNVENVNFEEIWFEFEYFDGLFDATQVQLEAVFDENL